MIEKRGQTDIYKILLFILIVILVIAGIVAFFYFYPDKTITCKEGGKYDEKLGKCVYPTQKIPCTNGSNFNQKTLLCEKAVAYEVDCEGIFNKTTGICSISPDETYSCEEGILTLVNDEYSCVVNVNNLINLNQTCLELGGNICSSSQTCSGNFVSASDSSRCCLGSCIGSGNVDIEGSPFGIYIDMPFFFSSSISDSETNELLEDIGINQVCSGFIFPTAWRVQNVMLSMSAYNRYKNANIDVLGQIMPTSYSGDTKGKNKSDGNNTHLGLKALYTALTVDSPIVYYDKIKYWRLPEESDGDAYDYPQRHAAEIRIIYKAIKSVNPNVKLFSAGTYGSIISYSNTPFDATQPLGQRPGYYKAIFEELKYMEEVEKGIQQYDGRYAFLNYSDQDLEILFSPDEYVLYMDGHHFSSFDIDSVEFGKKGEIKQTYRSSTEPLMNAMKNLLDLYGYGDIELWLTQTGAASNPISIFPDENCVANMYTYLTETTQASYLPRKFAVSMINGVDRFYWVSSVDFERYGSLCPNSYFTRTGLVHNGIGSYDLGLGVKKLSYYTYKLMVEKLEGSDWDNIQEVYNSSNVYAYKFINKQTQKPTYVVWWDYWNEPSLTSKNVNIPVAGITGNAKITEAVPHFENGLLLQNSGEVYPGFFDTQTKQVTNGAVSFTLGQNPVYIEAQ